MEHAPSGSRSNNLSDTSAFAVWLRRMLKTSHEDAMHEPIPRELLDLLPPAKDR